MGPTHVIEIARGRLRAGVAPALGGALAFFRTLRADGAATEWLRPMPADAQSPLAAASFPMVPFFSWMEGDTLTADGLSLPLPASGFGFAHALHGFGWTSAWEVEARAPGAVGLVHRHPGGAWPWPYTARQRIVLDGEGLEIALALTNDADTPMPAGLGLHPFFERGDGLRVTAATGAMHLMSEAVLPYAADPRHEAVAALASGDELPRGLDNIFEGWDGRALLRWPDRALRLTAGPPFEFLCIYAPIDGDIACIEPVTHTTNAFNLGRAAWGATGDRRLAPGETMTATARFHPEEF